MGKSASFYVGAYSAEADNRWSLLGRETQLLRAPLIYGRSLLRLEVSIIMRDLCRAVMVCLSGSINLLAPSVYAVRPPSVICVDRLEPTLTTAIRKRPTKRKSRANSPF